MSITPVYELTVDVRYRDGGTRASRFFSKHSPESVTQLKQDLEQLKFPTPEESNLSFVSEGCMKAFWIASLDSPLHKRLKLLVYRTKSPNFAHFWDSMTPATLEIEWMTLSETPVNPALQPNLHIPSHFNAGDSRRVDTAIQSNGNMKSALARKPYFALLSAAPLTMSRQGPTPNRAEMEHVKAPSAVAINSSAAKDVDTPVPFTSGTWNGSGWLVELPLRAEDGIELTSLLSTEPPRVPSDGSVAKSSQSTIPASSSTTAREDTTYETHRLLTPAARTQSLGSQNGKLQQPEHSGVLNVRQGGSSSGQLKQVQEHELSYTLDQIFNTVPVIDGVKEVLATEREARARFEASRNALQRALDSTRAKLTKVGDELRLERERCTKLEEELASERKRRVEAENALKDIERECRAPFVVPAMLEAFKTISILTTLAMDAPDKPLVGG